MPKFCSYCGSSLQENALFCSQCGKPVARKRSTRKTPVSADKPIDIPAPPGAKVTISDEMPVEPINIPAPAGAKVTISDEMPAGPINIPAPPDAKVTISDEMPFEPINIPAPAGARVTISDEMPFEPINIPAPRGAKVTISDEMPVEPINIPAPAGAKVTISDEMPEAVPPPKPPRGKKTTASSASKGRMDAEKPKESPAPKKRRGCGLSLFLAIVMVIELAVAGFKYPGFLLTGKSNPRLNLATAVPVSTQIPTAVSTQIPAAVSPEPSEQISPAPSQNTEQNNEQENQPVINFYLTEQLSLRYTDEQIASAPSRSAGISWWESQADLGDVKVQIDNWNLDEENDQLIVKTLPEISEGKEGWTIRAYDFSLASGQHEFPTDVAVTIPRTTDAMLTGCVWFNEAANAWQDVYYEASEDGKSYTIYADHFTILGEKSLKFDPDAFSLNSNDVSFNLNAGIFVEQPQKKLNRMLWPVSIDYTRMWNMYRKKTESDIRKMDRAIQSLMQRSDDIAANKEVYQTLDNLQNYFGNIGAASSAGTLPGDASEWILTGKNSSSSFIDDTLFELDVLLTTLKIVQEAKRGNYTIEEVVKDLPAAAWNHKLELTGVAISVTSAFLAPWAAAIVGLTWWAGTKIYSIDADNPRVDPTVEQMYQYVCTLKKTKMYYGTKVTASKFLRSDSNNIPMKKPSSMKEKDFKILKQTVDKKHLCRYVKAENITVEAPWYSPQTSTTITESKVCFKGWSEAFLAILTACEKEDSAYIENILDEFYWNYAYSFWELDEEILDSFAQMFHSTKKSGSFLSLYELNDRKEVTKAEKIRYTQNFVDLLKKETKPILIAALEKLQRESCEAMMADMEKRVVPMLNCELTFHVVDDNLDSSQTFKDSIYCVDWKKISGNKTYVKGGEGVRYDDERFITPMRFNNVSGPRFLPLLPSDTITPEEPSRNKPQNYYPYTSDFIPLADKKSDVVFRCTYYHFLMMGAPKQMLFKQTSSRSKYKADAGVLGNIEIPNLTVPVTETVINKYTKKKITVSTFEPVTKADVTVRIPRLGTVSYKFASIDSRGATFADSEFIEPVLEEAMKDVTITLSGDGSFSAVGSAVRTHDGPRDFITWSIIPDGDYDDPLIWSQSGYFHSINFELSGKYDLKTGDGFCTMSGSGSGNHRFSSGYKSGKTDSDSTSWNTTFEGTTDIVYLQEYTDGERFCVDFFWKNDDKKNTTFDLNRKSTVTRSDGTSENQEEGWWISLTFKKVN